jgi:hypothetical protein
MGPARTKGEASAGGVRCVVERRPGENVAVATPDGTFLLHELAVTVLRDEP